MVKPDKIEEIKASMTTAALAGNTHRLSGIICDRFGLGVREGYVIGEMIVALTRLFMAFKPTHRHKKQMTDYEVVATGMLQCEGPLPDEAKVRIYKNASGLYFVRAVSEFDDGRFEEMGDAGPDRS